MNRISHAALLQPSFDAASTSRPAGRWRPCRPQAGRGGPVRTPQPLRPHVRKRWAG